MGTILDIAYKSQYDPDASASRNDCGPACLAMLINAFGITATTDAVFQRTGALPVDYVSAAQLMRVGESYGVPLEYRKGWGLGQLRGMLDLGRPMIALVHYAVFSELQPGVSTQSPFKGPHFVVVVGYDDGNVIVHDPLWTGDRRNEGAFRKWRNDIWQQAWGRAHEDCDAQGRCNPDYMVLISVRAISLSARTQVSAADIRRIRARVALTGLPQPDLAQPASLNAYLSTLGSWGERRVVHVVQPTDTLWRLAKAYYGDGNRMDVIRYFNGLSETDVIRNGQILQIPEPTLSGEIPEDRVPRGVTPAPALGGPRLGGRR
jgi:LysM repeat protein